MNTETIILRKTEISDLDILFEIQLDAQANYLAAFTSKDYADKKKMPSLKNIPNCSVILLLITKPYF